MTIWYWGTDTFDPTYEELLKIKPSEKKRTKQKHIEAILDDQVVAQALRQALEQVTLSHHTSLAKLMEAPEGTPTSKQRGKRTTSERELDYDAYKPHYSWEE